MIHTAFVCIQRIQICFINRIIVGFIKCIETKAYGNALETICRRRSAISGFLWWFILEIQTWRGCFPWTELRYGRAQVQMESPPHLSHATEAKPGKRQSKGLPPKQGWFTVKRQCMTADHRKRVGIYFGTTNGEVWASTNEGESWKCIVPKLAPYLFCRIS